MSKSNTRVNVCLLQPTGYVHSLALLEAAEYMAARCTELGYKVSLQKNRLNNAGINIVFGAHLEPEKVKLFPENIVIFNTEQLTVESSWTKPSYKQLLESNYVFDYSSTNLACITHERKRLIPFLFCKSLSRLQQSPDPEIDLLFFGSLNERRAQILNSLGGAGLQVAHVYSVYGPPRDEHMINARTVLNLHYYESQIFQQIRAFYPLINRIPVISENFPPESAPDIYNEVIFSPGNQSLADYIISLDLKGKNFKQECDRRFALFESHTENAQFAEGVDAAVNSVGVTSCQTYPAPRRPHQLNLGSGKDYRIGYFNVDINPAVSPDALLDLSKKHEFPIDIKDAEGIPVVLDENQLDEIIAFDVLEHVPELARLMTNCLLLLKVGGKFTIRVPYDLSLGAWQDPTHIRAFNENSWLYYTDWSWYLGWYQSRFQLTEMKYELSKDGRLFASAGQDLQAILKTPRAVDSMFVTLEKRILTPEEKTVVFSYSHKIE